MTFLTTLPEVDRQLVIDAQASADAATIHSVNTEIGIYVTSVDNVNSLDRIIRKHGYKVGDMAEMKRRVSTARDYEQKLRARVSEAKRKKAQERLSQ